MSFIKNKINQVKDWQNPDREENPTVCDPVVINAVDKDLYAKLLIEAQAGGIVFNGDKASLHDGPISLEFDWNWDETTTDLTITCTKKPFIFSCDTVKARLIDLVVKAKSSI
jgi:hypothetical protein